MADSSDSEGEVDNLLRRAIESIVAPIRFLTSRSAIKAYLSTLLFILTSIALLAISTTAYLFFYYNYIPPINLQKNIYLQYGLGACPYAISSLENTALIPQQAYDVEIQLIMPRTPTNLAAGNFMVDMQLLGPYNPLAQPPDSLRSLRRNMTTPTTSGLSVLYHSRRPAMLTYTSPIPFLAQTLLFLPFHLLNVHDLDSACLRIPMFELLSFPRGTANIPTHIRLEIQSDSSANTGSTPPTFNIPYLGSASAGTASASEIKPRVLQVYSSKISFCARFSGLRYAVYNWRVTSFLVFTALFYMSSISSMALAWAGISIFFGKDDEGGVMIKREDGTVTGEEQAKEKGKIEEEAQDDAGVKKEDEDSTSGGLSPSNLSDTPTTFPTGTRQPPLHYPGRPQASASAAAAQQRLRAGDVADDEEGDDGQSRAMMERAWERGREGDSGIGTSMESEVGAGSGGAGLVRRRSGSGSGSGSRERSFTMLPDD